MMKISKPLLTSEFILSPVQFTSLNSIVFKNVKNVYDGNEKISLEYEHSRMIESSSRDWIGIFPRGWSTLQQYITFEWVSQSMPCVNNEQNKENGDLIRRMINFCPQYYVTSINNNFFYQFVYVSKQIEVLGVSSYFRFDISNTESNIELECLVPVSSKLRSASTSDFGVLLAKNIPSTTSIDTRTLQTTSIHSLQNLDASGKNWAKPQILLNVTDLKKSSVFQRKSTGTGDILDPYSSHSEPVFPMSFQMTQCKKCFHFKRGGEFLRSQQVLQSKVGPRSEEASEFSGQRRTLGLELMSEDKLKIVMERNKILEERAQEMKKEMEKLQVESKKLKMYFYNINKEKVAYEKFVKDFIKSLEKDSIVRVVNGNTEILVKKVNYVGMEEHPRDKKTSKRERELKAVIGLQEITIRNLINSLQEKAKSVQDLDQTVKLAQAFSTAAEDSRDFGSDAEEIDEVSNSDETSEYEFSLPKSPPMEEVTVENTDAVLDDIRRTSEMELKDIGISRCLRKSSRESQSALPNLSVLSYQNQNEGIRPKKPRLFDNVEDCWPFPDNTPKTVHRKIIESSSNANCEQDTKEQEQQNLKSNPGNEEELDKSNILGLMASESIKMENDKEIDESEVDRDQTNYENFYDAYEVFNTTVLSQEKNSLEANCETEDSITMTDKSKNEKKDKNFLITAIIPQDLNVSSEIPSEDRIKAGKEKLTERKLDTDPERGKKFTCELSIDFAAKVLQKEESNLTQQAIEGDVSKESQNQNCNSFDLVPSNIQLKKEESFVTLQKPNKCLQIKITQVDKKENYDKKYVHQKMVVKFEKDSPMTANVRKPPKFEFNLAVKSGADNAKLMKTEPDDLQNLLNLNTTENGPIELKSIEEQNTEMDVSPRTVWNDASDQIVEEGICILEQHQEDILCGNSSVEIEEKQNSVIEEPKEEFTQNLNNMKLYQDSLRYEKNLEFLQQKTEEKIKNEEEEVTKDKPSAILIQNGPTKLALIRYQ